MAEFDMQKYLKELYKTDKEAFTQTITTLNINPSDYGIIYQDSNDNPISYIKTNQSNSEIQRIKKHFIRETFLEDADVEEISQIKRLSQLEETIAREVIAAKSDKKVIGAIWFIQNYNDPKHSIQENYTYIDKVFVEPEFRGNKIAYNLLEAVEKLTRRGTLLVADANSNSRALFENNSYEAQGYFRAFGNDFTTMVKQK
ncbi:GNAT family N-acetyltransferase [Candidatus Woesearchaeota archaeon]|nr:GNAT family N-acetyltransferase [Candidatus Woesearchaeota archaeon]